MAVTLSIQLNDSEQAAIAEIAEHVAPGLTPLQLKTWAETTAKEQLRNEVVRIWTEFQREQENQTRRAAEEALVQAWPAPVSNPTP